MGIKPAGTTPIIVPPDNVQSRWGEYEASLDNSGEIAGEVITETWALANSANTGMQALSGARGYVNAYMGTNQNAEWGLNNWRTMNFNRQHGPSLGASVLPNGTIRLGSMGLWQIGVRTTADSSVWGGSPNLVMEIDVLRADGTVAEMKRVETHSRVSSSGVTTISTLQKTVETIFPIVALADGYTIRVRCYTGQWRWWLGGTRFSHLTAIKHSGDPVNTGDSTVPNESQ